MIINLRHLYFFFFFQAEDGIRDYKVTGVQTCALPISVQKPARPDVDPALHEEREVAHRLRVEAHREPVGGPVEHVRGGAGAEPVDVGARRDRGVAARDHERDAAPGAFHGRAPTPCWPTLHPRVRATRCTSSPEVNPSFRSAGVRKRWMS